ncbi:MAG TPA: aromatic amino acid lyase, partial [Giesbergeria sp.]|nr:aromatic amino acid lyase [Giesbergeria sp.]
MPTTTQSPLTLHPGKVTLAELRRIHAAPVQLSLDAAARAGMKASQATVQRIVDEDQVVYGINTG